MISGTATTPTFASALKIIAAPVEWLAKGARLWLDLGDVKNRPKSPSMASRSASPGSHLIALVPGKNTLEITVTDAWANRIIGDRRPNARKTCTFTSPKFYKSDSKLVAAGLLGPVKIIRATQE